MEEYLIPNRYQNIYRASPCILTNSTKITDKKQMLNSFNSHFVASGSLFPMSNDVISDLEILKLNVIYGQESLFSNKLLSLMFVLL